MADMVDFGDGNTFQAMGAYHWALALGASPAKRKPMWRWQNKVKSTTRFDHERVGSEDQW